MVKSTQDIDTGKTAGIFRAIDGIAFQTSLLAHSAAVEDAQVQGAASGAAGRLAVGGQTAMHRLAVLSAGVSAVKH